MNRIKYIDFVVIALTLVGALGLIGYVTPKVISPLSDMSTTNSSVLFAFDKANTIMIDDNLEFSSPEIIHAENNLVVSLKPGVYYWKIKGITESIVHKLNIVSDVELKLESSGQNDSQYEVTNAGNVPLNVEIYNNSNLENNITLLAGNSANSSGTLFIGRENGTA
jgi:hypothetical protein